MDNNNFRPDLSAHGNMVPLVVGASMARVRLRTDSKERAGNG